MAMIAVPEKPRLDRSRSHPFPEHAVLELQVDAAADRWHVLHTKSRQEKAVARALAAGGIAHYLPLVRCVTYRGARKATVEKPLFGSYVFLYGALEATYFAISTKRIAQVIPISNQVRFEYELQQVRDALERGGDLTVGSHLALGRRVRVVAGPLEGIEGHIEQCQKPHRLVLQVAVLGQAASLEIDRDLLEPVD